MPLPKRPENKSLDATKGPVRVLALRISRAAGDINPLLIVLAIGLLVLDITLYLGLAVAHESFVWSPPRQANSFHAQAASIPMRFPDGAADR